MKFLECPCNIIVQVVKKECQKFIKLWKQNRLNNMILAMDGKDKEKTLRDAQLEAERVRLLFAGKHQSY